MPKPLPPIHESEEELLALFNTIHDRERRNRIHAVFLVKMGYCQTRKAVAQALHVERKAVERWLKHYEHDGLPSLLVSHRSHCGKRPRIQGEPLAQLHAKLNQPEGFQGYQSICTWLHERFGLDVPYKTVHSTVYYRLKGSPKVPRKSNVKKERQREEAFKKNVRQTPDYSPTGQHPPVTREGVRSG
jgi:transposase